ncbi:MAG TPA: class I SAM-dependent methyltransferase, partial [Flavobacterium sp.]|nr:class I SAM-dependent methyltransferase [Flavobacterium sp.]
MWFQVRSYFKFLTKSTNQYGVHSPFVFDLLVRCLYDKKQYPEYERITQYRRTVLASNQVIEVADFGAGSKVFKFNTRSVSDIAKNAGISKQRSKMLFRIARYYASERIMEIGTSVGLATAALAVANENAIIVSLEGCPETANVA